MQFSGQIPRASTFSNGAGTPLTAPASSPRLDVDGQILNGDTSPRDGRRVSANTDPGSLASRTTSAESDQSQDSYQQYGSTSRKSRRSGSFLLSDPGPAARKFAQSASKAKGKGKEESGDLIIPKRTTRSRHQFKPSVGSSPLAIEVLNDTSASGRDDGIESISTSSKGSRRVQGNNDMKHGNIQPRNGGASGRETIPALGFDTDPAQIVNLALSLSESRRRNFSGGLLAPINAIGDRRIISGVSASSGLPTMNGGGSLRQQLQQQRRISRNISPRSGIPQRKDASPKANQDALVAPPPIVPIPAFVQSSELPFNPSDATLARAEKARIALELSYEYRRLLQYLPELPVQNGGSANRHQRVKSSQQEAGDLGRHYNPLQYVRNRKIRLRERQPFDSEADGWRDIERVRRWIDTVAQEREIGIATINDRYPLPAFEDNSAISRDGGAMLAPSPTKLSPVQGTKQRRPRMDWTFTPWDLLADAYWLQHDGNIARTEDSAGQKMVLSSEDYTMQSAKNSLDTDRGSHLRKESIDRQAVSPTKVRSSRPDARNQRSRERGRRPEQMEDQESPQQHANTSRDRKGRWPRKLIRSRSSSTSSHSDRDGLGKSKRGRHQDEDHFGSAVLEKHMMSLLAQEGVADDDIGSQTSRPNKNIVEAPVARDAEDQRSHSRLRLHQRTSSERKSARDVHRIDHGSVGTSARSSLERPNRRNRKNSYDDLDTTAPSSPSNPGFTPSIAINSSRPTSPHISPKKPLPSFRPARSKERQAISENDFALSTPSSTDLSRQATRDSKLEDASRRERVKTEMNGFLSPTADGFTKIFRRSDSTSKGSKESNETDSRFRGFFRGGRIAEIVGNEVGRVGDRLWRKDASSQASQVASPASSHASDDSDTEDLDGLESSPEFDLPRTTTNNESKPKYFTANLPSFQSSTLKGTEAEKPRPPSSTEDPITRQQLAQRERGRSARFERLAPPKIDMRNISPSPSPPLTRTQTRNIVPSYDPFDSRQSSASRSKSRVREADRRLNAVLGIPGTVGRGGPPMTGLASLESRKRRSRERPVLEGKRQWSISDRSVSAVRGTVTKRDIARVRALLLSSGVKANEIARRAHEVSESPSPVLQNLEAISGKPIPRISRSQEHAFAARIYTSRIEENTRRIREAAEIFSSQTVDQLHQQIKEIDECFTEKLTPLVRTSADEADAFSAQLTTTHTLEVKQLHDAVDAILRRRRRRLRWIRRAGYVLLEWTLLGIMWWVWLIVVIIRLIRCTIGGFFKAVQWLLWL